MAPRRVALYVAPTMDDFANHLPVRALLISLAALAVPVTVALLQPGWLAGEQSFLIWLTPLIPGFLLTYHRGWAGASMALAGAMAAISTAHLALGVTGSSPPGWGVILAVLSVYLTVTLGSGWMADLLRRERRNAREMALTDPLTGLPNRRHAWIFLEAAHAGAARGIPMTVVLFDIDHFKSFNDRFGHAAGDRALRALGRVLQEQTRRMNISARHGGEEFLSVLVNSDAEGAVVFAERVREALREEAVGPEPITVSGGVAECLDGGGTPDLVLESADRALYRAKREGRDRIEVADTGPAESAEGAREGERDATSADTVPDDPERGGSERGGGDARARHAPV